MTAFLKAHERLVIILLIIAASILFYYKGISYLASRDQLAANKTALTLQAQANSNAQEATDAKTTLLQYQQLAEQLVASNQAISLAQQKLQSGTQKQQQIDKSLPPLELAMRWTNLIKGSPDSVQPSSIGYTVTADGAAKTVNQLELVPEYQGLLANEETIVTNQANQITNQGKVVTSLTSQVVGLNLQIVDQTKADTVQITLLKAQNRKSKFKWFVVGYVAGFISREIIKP